MAIQKEIIRVIELIEFLNGRVLASETNIQMTEILLEAVKNKNVSKQLQSQVPRWRKEYKESSKELSIAQRELSHLHATLSQYKRDYPDDFIILRLAQAANDKYLRYDDDKPNGSDPSETSL